MKMFFIFYGREGVANTNNFIFLLTDSSYLVYFLFLILIIFFIFLLNKSYRKKNYLAVFFSFIITVVLIEQSIFTSLLTSGFILILPILFLIQPLNYKN